MNIDKFVESVDNHILKGEVAGRVWSQNKMVDEAGFNVFNDWKKAYGTTTDLFTSVRGGFTMDDYSWARLFAQQDSYIREDWQDDLLNRFTWIEKEQEKSLIEEMFHRN